MYAEKSVFKEREHTSFEQAPPCFENKPTETSEVIPGTDFEQVTKWDKLGCLKSITIDGHCYIEKIHGQLVFDNDFVSICSTMTASGMVRQIKTPYARWQEWYKTDLKRLPLSIDGMQITRDKNGRVTSCKGHQQDWQYDFTNKQLAKVTGPFGQRQILRDNSSRPIRFTQAHYSKDIHYDQNNQREQLPTLPDNYYLDNEGRLRSVLNSDNSIKYIYLWDGYNCLARLDGEPGSPLSYVYSLDMTGTPVRLISRNEQIAIPRDAYGENLLKHEGHPGLFGGTIYHGYVWFRSRVMDSYTASFNAPDPLHGGKDDRRRQRGFQDELLVETPKAGPYVVCQYDPITFFDPTGEIAWYYLLSTLTWAFPNNILSWVGLEATANFWGTFFTGKWSDWKDAEHWKSDRLDISGIQRQSFFAPKGGGAFTTQHLIWAEHDYIDQKRRVTVFDPGGTYTPDLYASMLRLVPTSGSPFLLAGQKIIGGITQDSAHMWVRAGGTSVAAAPGQKTPVFPAGGLHFQFRDPNISGPQVELLLGPQSATVTELTATNSVGTGTLNNNSTISIPLSGITLNQGDLLLLTDGANALDIVAVITTIPDGSQQTVRLAAAPDFSTIASPVTTGITLRPLQTSDWTENLSNNGMPAVNYLDASSTTNAYQVNDALRLDDSGTLFNAQITGFETQVTLDAALDGTPVIPMTVFAITVNTSNDYEARIITPTEVDFESGPVPEAGDYVTLTDGSTTLVVIIISTGTDNVRTIDRNLSGLTGPAINWHQASRGSDLGSSDSLPTTQLTYVPAALSVVPAVNDHIGIEYGPASSVTTQLRSVTAINHHALVLNTSSALPASTSFAVNHHPVGNQINNLSLSQTLILGLTRGNVANAVAIQVYQFVGSATPAAGTTIATGMELNSAVASTQLSGTSGTLTPNQPVIATSGSTIEPLVTKRVSREIFINFDFTSTSSTLEIVPMEPKGFAYDSQVSDVAQVIVSPIVSTSGTSTAADMPGFSAGECIELMASGTVIGQYQISAVPEGTVLELGTGPALPVVGTAITVKKVIIIPSGTGSSRVAINGQMTALNSSGSSRVIKADVWDKNALSNGTYIGVIDGNQTHPFVLTDNNYDVTVPATNQVDIAPSTIDGKAVDTPTFVLNELVQLNWQDSVAQSQQFQVNNIAGTVLSLTPNGGAATSISSTGSISDVMISHQAQLEVEFTSPPSFTGPVDIAEISANIAQFFGSFTRETDQSILMPDPGTLNSPSSDAVIVVPLAATGTMQTGTLSSGTGKVPEDPENPTLGEHDRHQMLVEHELRHTEQYMWWGPMFITLIPLWPLELGLELGTDIEQPDFGTYQQGNLEAPAGGAMKITFTDGTGGFSIGQQVQVTQGAQNVNRQLTAPASGESGFRIESASELSTGDVFIRVVNNFPDWYRVVHGSWFRTLTIGGLTQLAASLTHGLFFQIVGRFFYMIYRSIQMACCDDRQSGTVQASKTQIRLTNASASSALNNVDRLLIQEPQNFGNALFSGIDTVVRSRVGTITEGVITLSAPLEWDDGTTVNVGPYQTRTPGQLSDWKEYYPAIVQTDNHSRLQVLPVGTDTLSLEPFDRLRVIAESEHFGMFNSIRTVISVSDDMIEINEAAPISGSEATELTIRIAKIGTEDPFDFLDTVGVDELTGGGWLRWVTDPFGQLHSETQPSSGTFLDILARTGKYVMGTKAWTNPILLTSRYFAEAMTKDLHNVSLEQDASEQSGNLYTPIGRVRGEARINENSVTMTVGDIARFWYFGYEFSDLQNSLPSLNGGSAATYPVNLMDEAGNHLKRDQIIYPQQTAETGAGNVNQGAQGAALNSSPGLDLADAFWQKQPGDPNEVSLTLPDRHMVPNDLGFVPQSAQLQLSSSVYMAFTRPTGTGITHRATMVDSIDNGKNGRDAQNEDAQHLFFNITVEDVTVNFNGTAPVNDTVTLLRTQTASISVSDEGSKQYAVRVMQPTSGSIVRASFLPNNTLNAQDPFSSGSGPFSEPFQVCRWHDFNEADGVFRSGGLARHNMHLPEDIFIPVRKMTVNIAEFPPVLTVLPATLDFSMYTGGSLPNIQPGGQLFFPVAANILTATPSLNYRAPPMPDNTVKPTWTLSDISSTTSQQVQDFLGDGLVYSLTMGASDVPEEQSSINIIFTVGDTGLTATMTITIAVDGHFLARDVGALAASGYEIATGSSGDLTCVELDGTSNVTPDASNVVFTLRNGSTVPQVIVNGSPEDEMSFSAAGNILTINVNANANTGLDSGFRRLIILDAGGNIRAARTIKIV